MNRSDLQKLAKLRVKEAKVLLDNKHYEGAYYLLGYAIECAFKACIAKQIRRYEFPDKKLVNDMYTHDLSRLLTLSGLDQEHRRESRNSQNFALNWAIVKDWSESMRYDLNTITPQKARDFYSAVINRRYGVLSWLKKWW
ncbi:MAG: HEPN domain-containing protein [Blastocatellales bacterium]